MPIASHSAFALSASIRCRKRLVRQAATLRLRTLPPDSCAERSERLADRLLAEFGPTSPCHVLLFAPIAGSRIPEVDLSPLARRCDTPGAPRLYVPRVDWNAGRMIPTRVHRWPDDLIPGPRGVCEPPPDAPSIPEEDLDVILLPGLAFDPAGRRVGRGGGFYDRFLADPRLRARRVAVCFDRQLFDGPLPTEPHDVDVHRIVTESRTLVAGENL